MRADELLLRRRDLLRGATALASFSLLRAGSAHAGDLHELTRRPTNYESPLDVFRSRITPIDSFYLRSHFDVPTIDASTWRLQVEGLVDAPLSLSLADLEVMPQVTVEAVLQCSGNGRALFSPRIPGVQWRKGAMGNARWTGVRLRDVIEGARPRSSSTGARFVELQGADRPVLPATPSFIRGIPVAKALHEDTLVALKMNDVPLPRLHGGPARLVAPGWVGDDWTKWLARVSLQADEPKGFFYEKAYRFPVEPGPPGAPVTTTKTMERLVVKSIIAGPLAGAVIAPGPQEVRGVAFSGEAGIKRVDVSLDGGKTWRSAALETGGKYGFTSFSLAFTATPGVLRVMSRATDERGATQPAAAVWNAAGYLHNAIDVVDCEVRA